MNPINYTSKLHLHTRHPVALLYAPGDLVPGLHTRKAAGTRFASAARGLRACHPTILTLWYFTCCKAWSAGVPYGSLSRPPHADGTISGFPNMSMIALHELDAKPRILTMGSASKQILSRASAARLYHVYVQYPCPCPGSHGFATRPT
jgi:hypothetical protein